MQHFYGKFLLLSFGISSIKARFVDSVSNNYCPPHEQWITAVTPELPVGILAASLVNGSLQLCQTLVCLHMGAGWCTNVFMLLCLWGGIG